MTFSKTLEHTGSKERGRRNNLFIIFLMYWNKVTLFPIVKIVKFGKVPNSKQLCNIMRSGFMTDEYLSFNILTETPS